MAIDTSNLDISSRDFLSIYGDLISARDNLTKDWNTNDENDPGIVLLKLISMTGDMLSYNHDRAVLEVYPETVQQRKNAAQIFALIGYKMHWYQSATTEVTIVNNTSITLYVPSMTTFVTSDGSITYTYIGNTVSIPMAGQATLSVTQGVPKTPSLLSNTTFSNPNDPWYSVYDYNIVKSDVINNKIYFADTKIDERNIILVDSDGYVWQQVEKIDAEITAGRFFELKIDNEDKPYIELPVYWENLDSVSKFRLFYLVTDGINGAIKENTLTSIGSKIYALDGSVATTTGVVLSNSISTIGYDYETPAEARDNASTYINTYDTLITLKDFEKATKRIQGVANCYATDKTNNPDPSGMTNTDLIIYVTKKDAWVMPDDEFKEQIISELSVNKNLLYDIDINFDDITDYYWTIKCVIYLKERVNQSAAQSLIVQIRNALATKYAVENIQYNTLVSYLDVLETIRNVSSLVYNVDVDGIKYYTDETKTTEVTNKAEISGKILDSEELTYTGSGPYETTITVSELPIKPGTLTLTLDDTLIISDNNFGSLACDSAQFLEGTVDYSTGEITLSLNAEYENCQYSYQVNKINLVRYCFSINDLIIADESIEK